MKEKRFNCVICGKEVVYYARMGKYCPECAKGKKQQQSRESRQRRKNGVVKMSNDTEAMRKLCLNCNRARCYGECEALAIVARREKHGKECTA